MSELATWIAADGLKETGTANPLPVNVTTIVAGQATAANQATEITALGLLATAAAQTTGNASAAISAQPGLSASVTITRPSDTTTYGAQDVVGVTGGGTGCIDFNLGAISGSIILITSLRFQRDATALIASEAGYTLYLFSITQPGAQADNATFTVAAGDQASYLGKIAIPTPVDEGATLSIDVDGINKQVKLAGTHIFGTLTTTGAYQPVSAAVHRLTLHAIQR